MNLINSIKMLFGTIKNTVGKYWRELGGYSSTFSQFGKDIYANDIVRACVRTLAEHSSKANVKVLRKTDDGRYEGDKKLQRMIQYRPNIYMNGKDFIYKVRTLLEIHNTVFIYIRRDDYGKCVGLYPLPHAECDAIDVGGELYIKFYFSSGIVMAHSWEDLAVLRKDYNSSDVFGDSNNALYSSLELLNTTSQGMANAIKSTANLRGIIKSTKAMLNDDDVRRLKERFETDYMNLSNKSGIASLDATMDFTPLNLQPQLANYKNIEELRMNVYRYFGLNEDVIMSNTSGDAWEAFYEARLEPFLIALGLELTNKIFTDKQKGFGNEIIFEANRLQYASTTTKMSMVQLIDRGILTINEYREVLNLAPVEGGDVRIIRKEYAEANKLNLIQGVEDNANQSGQGIQGDVKPDDNTAGGQED